jgi:hypothetical protein
MSSWYNLSRRTLSWNCQDSGLHPLRHATQKGNNDRCSSIMLCRIVYIVQAMSQGAFASLAHCIPYRNIDSTNVVISFTYPFFLTHHLEHPDEFPVYSDLPPIVFSSILSPPALRTLLIITRRHTLQPFPHFRRILTNMLCDASRAHAQLSRPTTTT